MPSIPPALVLNTNENKNNNNSVATLSNSTIIIPASSNTNNWQSYFNNKINNSKEKFNVSCVYDLKLCYQIRNYKALKCDNSTDSHTLFINILIYKNT